MLNKRAQVGQTMTWMVATIIILLILGLFIFASGSEGFRKMIGAGSEIKDKGSVLINQQTLFALLSKNNSEIKTLIEGDNFEQVKEKIAIVLDEFEEKGVECSFSGRKGINTITDYRKPIEHTGGFFAGDILEINDFKMVLEC